MASINLDSPFIHYEFTESEVRPADMLGELNRMRLQNYLYEATMEKLELERTDDTRDRAIVLTGKIEVLREILRNHDIATAETNAELMQGHPTTMHEGVPIHKNFPNPGIRMPDGTIVRPEPSGS